MMSAGVLFHLPRHALGRTVVVVVMSLSDSISPFRSDVAAIGGAVKRYAGDFGPALRGARTDFGAIAPLRDQFAFDGAPLRPYELDSATHREGSNAYAVPLQQTEDVNPRITVQGRRFMSIATLRETGANIGAPSVHRLAFTWRQAPAFDEDRPQNISVRVPSYRSSHVRSVDEFMLSSYGTTGTFKQAPAHQHLSVQMLPTLAAEPCAMNFLLADMQREWARRDPTLYLRINEEMLFYGTRHLAGTYPTDILRQLQNNLPGFKGYEGFDLEGIPRQVATEDGALPPVGSKGHASRVTTVTLTANGAELCLDYWNAAGLEAGTLLYAILKKSPPDTYRRPAGVKHDDTGASKLLYTFSYTADSKTPMTRVLDLPGIPVPSAGGKRVPMRPYQWHFVTSRTTLDREHAKYEDEWGHTRYGLVIYIGYILSPPPGGPTKPPTQPGKSMPYMDDSKVARSTPMEIILNPDSGLYCI